jgi:hypothetical protein
MALVVDPENGATANSVVQSVGSTEAAAAAAKDSANPLGIDGYQLTCRLSTSYVEPATLKLAPMQTTCEPPAFSETDGGADANQQAPPYEEELLSTSYAGGLSQIIFGPP